MSIALRTERLLLRRIVASDEEIQMSRFAEPEAQEMILASQRNTNTIRARFRNALENIGIQEASGDHYLTVVLLATGEIIGNCTVLYAYEGSLETALGWHISARFSGRGLGTEMVKELLRFSFEDAGTSLATADCFSHNLAGIRVLEKAGMSPVGTGRFARWLLALRYGEKRPISRFTLSRERWLSSHGNRRHLA